MTALNSEAGPSRPASLPRKSSAPHPNTKSKLALEKRKLPPPLPSKPTQSSHPSASINPNGKSSTLPLKTLQGVSRIRSDSTKNGFGREVIFVTRKTGLGVLLGRCRSLVVDEGYTSLRFHAIGAAIPQSLLLLHALLDLLPYPIGEKGMWYEIKTGSVECIDEISKSPSTKEKGQGQEGEGEQEEGLEWLNDIGAVEEDIPERKSRIKSTIQIDLHISPRPSPKRKVDVIQPKETDISKKKDKKSTRNRPSKKKRQQLAIQRNSTRNEEEAMNDEEEMMNLQNDVKEQGGIEQVDEESEEEIEEVEMR